jgi:hypothetical protein
MAHIELKEDAIAKVFLQRGVVVCPLPTHSPLCSMQLDFLQQNSCFFFF